MGKIACLLCLLAGPVAAQTPVLDDARVADCLAHAVTGDTAPACLGDASNACQNATPGGSTTIGISACIQAETAAWDRLLNQQYQATRARFRETQTVGDAPSVVEALTTAQRAWIAYRDAECLLSYRRWQGGSIRAIVAANCGLAFTAARTIELRDMRGEP